MPGIRSAEYECTAEFRAGTLECDFVSPAGETGARLNIMLYEAAAKAVGSGSYSGGDKSNPDTMTFNIALLNRIPQPIGTQDGSTADTSRLVITGYSFTPTSGVTGYLANASGIATFVDSTNGGTPITYPNAEYMNYVEIIAPNDTSSAKLFQFVFSPSATSMRFRYRVWTRVQYPYGWIGIAPSATPALAPGETTSLTGTVYDHLGQVQADGMSWSSSNMSVAAVNSSTGQVTAVGEGTATITATSTVDVRRTGTRVVAVDRAPAVAGTTPANGGMMDVMDNIVVTFSEPVSVSTSSFSLGCTTGPQPVSVSGTETATITVHPINPPPSGDTCTLTVVAAHVSDADPYDGPNLMVANYIASFEVTGFGGMF